jgi:glycerophosphoryl diester phosphodiesterase
VLKTQGHIEVHGHRGARARYSENTLAAFDYAIALGVDAIELDVAVTRDNVVVVSHDPVLEAPLFTRPSGPAARAVIRDATFAELRQWDCGSVRHPDFPRQQTCPGAHVPSLDEVFGLAPRGGFKFNVEIKSFPDRPELAPEPEEFARLVWGAIRKHALEERVIVQSFDARVLRAMKRLAPGVALAALFEEDLDFVEAAQLAEAGTAAPEHQWVDAAKVRRAHAAGIRVIPWTANAPADWKRLSEAQVDGIITDDPEALIAFFRAPDGAKVAL